MSPNLFVIYINKIFHKILETSLLVTSLLLIDDLGFIAFGSLVKEIVRSLKKIAKKVIEWEK